MNNRGMFLLIVRYLMILILAMSNLAIFYFLFTPLTIHPLYFVLHNQFPDSVLYPYSGAITIFNPHGDGENYSIELNEACIAGSAYFLLFILNLSTPMSLKTRLKSLCFLISSFLILNILRAFIFSLLFVWGYTFFDITHRLVWYFGSTLLVVIIWFTNMKVFRILSIPIYTDLKTISEDIFPKRGKDESEIKSYLKARKGKAINN